MRCPKCGGPNVYVRDEHTWICEDCEHQWEDGTRHDEFEFNVRVTDLEARVGF